uniref:Uncharacterized protein n=1 Tax=Leersia perrieri TaxID=77586 RepID=A0A0D9XVK2_9ORYZ
MPPRRRRSPELPPLPLEQSQSQSQSPQTIDEKSPIRSSHRPPSFKFRPRSSSGVGPVDEALQSLRKDFKGIVAKIKDLETTQTSYVIQHCASEVCVGEVEVRKERKVTEVRAELSLQVNTRQLQGGDTLSMTAA